MLHRRSVTIAALIAVGLLALYWLVAPRPVLVETAVIAEGRFTALVEEDGRTRVRNRYVVSAPLTGSIARIALRAGDAVKAGQAVATLVPNIPPLIEARTRGELGERIGAAEASLEEAKAMQERAQAVLVKARADLQRTSELKSRGVASIAQFDRDTAIFQAAERDGVAADRHRHAAELSAPQALCCWQVKLHWKGAAAGIGHGRPDEGRRRLRRRLLRPRGPHPRAPVPAALTRPLKGAPSP